jgi:hypothetical protein
MDIHTGFVKLSLYFPEKEEYIHVLTIPLQKCFEFSHKPLKWLRYLGYTLYGKEGHIYSMDGEGQQQTVPVNYVLQIENGDHHYCFRSEGK